MGAAFDCRAHAMKAIANLFQLVWQGDQADLLRLEADEIDDRDRSSMADFVRILQEAERESDDSPN